MQHQIHGKHTSLAFGKAWNPNNTEDVIFGKGREGGKITQKFNGILWRCKFILVQEFQGSKNS